MDDEEEEEEVEWHRAAKLDTVAPRKTRAEALCAVENGRSRSLLLLRRRSRMPASRDGAAIVVDVGKIGLS